MVTGEKDATDGMPGVEEIARAIASWRHRVTPANPYRPSILPSERAQAAAVLALFAPILAEKEREIATFESREAEWNEAIANSLQNEEEAHRKLEAAEAALAAERERCAKVAEDHGALVSNEPIGKACSRNIAAAIRAEGE